MPDKSDSLYREAVIRAYRAELIARYSDANIARFSELRGFPINKREELRGFFLTHLYPEFEERPRRDAAFDNLGQVLRAPRKMLVLMKSAIGSVWTLGRQFPAAVKAGFRTLEAYLQSHRLEDQLTKAAVQSKIPVEKIGEPAHFAALIRALPKRDVLAFRKDILLLFQSLANHKLLAGSLRAMEHSKETMLAHSGLFSKEEISGLEMGISMLASGYALFSSLEPEEIDLILTGIELIECRWYDEILAMPPL